jgi:hypothetical protein
MCQQNTRALLSISSRHKNINTCSSPPHPIATSNCWAGLARQQLRSAKRRRHARIVYTLYSSLLAHARKHMDGDFAKYYHVKSFERVQVCRLIDRSSTVRSGTVRHSMARGRGAQDSKRMHASSVLCAGILTDLQQFRWPCGSCTWLRGAPSWKPSTHSQRAGGRHGVEAPVHRKHNATTRQGRRELSAPEQNQLLNKSRIN